ncbi:helix-turn-helix domain-containing protein [Microbacterium sp. APC 3898]|uniref:Helix-turn-helix domain-containing protein n=2 Tax=Planococcus TaxID=1372 RepID=A0ABT7ZHD0_9BACL|nr:MULTISPECIES: helix-turn-helix domain-containing protein [Terrabacteria group]MBF6634990.1 PucR family transcriptional regulator [Planococcus sp. (in: firmicutes)]MBD8015417.1 PucR family transcriptional regulator [Planococcus wigleyi]MDN3426548.1 helix-turn-helix domain-containing protein [Planococcus sp. APC 4016]MDN3437804.1 helix-turn-helix domain-containing protein [Planococcus sp. APC 3900]MDN3500490.1 helix-turn-helix domain-containing protein [Microbacterium sp. APC 3898]
MNEMTPKNPFKKSFFDLKELVDSIHENLLCPVTIEDTNHRLHAYSSHEDDTDAARIGTIISQRVPEKVINRLWKEGIIPKLMQSDAALRIPHIEDIGLRDRVAIAIRKNNEILGYIWVVEGPRKLMNEQLDLLKDAASAATPLMAKLYQNRKRKEENYQDFFWQLLTGQYKSLKEIHDKFYDLNLRMPDSFTVLTFRFQQDITRKMEEQLSYLITTSQKIINHFLVVMDEELILIASPHPSQPADEAFDDFISFFISEMANRFSILDVEGAYGTSYGDIDKAETSYQEASKVLEMKKRFPEELENVFHFRRLGVFRYMDVLHKDQRAKRYEHPAIAKLETYDRLHNSNLLKTLEVFIQQDSNMNDAAKKLFVHTNTLHYRIKRISEIGSIRLSDVNEKLGIYLDLKARKFDEK